MTIFTPDAVSNALGLASSAAWLGAQFPQLWTNYRLQSADGLALPFLANWLAGDATNLIGCLLTNQLPFQTYLAVYFVWVDFCLLSQYLYYESYLVRKRQKLGISTGTAEIASPLTASPTAAFPGASLPRRTGSRMRAHSYSRQPLPLHDDTADETAGDELPAMTESFHSEHRKGASLVGHRGRGLARPEGEVDHAEERRKRISQASGRGASLVFLAVFGMWGVGFGGGQGASGVGMTERIGRVLPRPTPYIQNTVHPSDYFAASPRGVVQLQYIPPGPYFVSQTTGETEPATPTNDTDRTSWAWVVGRISAWTCTTLYLTSRMPQIWKNYTRQSVDGLSISLFVFAFLGNFFYVASVLTSSRMFGTPVHRLQYLKDSLPYLLGSAGTFVFDCTIVIQSFVYRGLRPVTSTTIGQPRRRYTAAAHSTEQDALLGHSRSRSVEWSRRSPSVTRGRTSIDRFGKKARPSIERSGYGSMQGAVPGQSGAA